MTAENAVQIQEMIKACFADEELLEITAQEIKEMTFLREYPTFEEGAMVLEAPNGLPYDEEELLVSNLWLIINEPKIHQKFYSSNMCQAVKFMYYNIADDCEYLCYLVKKYYSKTEAIDKV